MSKILIFILLASVLISCADEKTFYLNGTREALIKGEPIEAIHAETYGWANYEARKDPNVIYEPCIGNVIWSVIGFETIVVPIWLTGWELYEPVRLKDCAPNCDTYD